MDHDSSIPENCNVVPSQRRRDNWNVYKARGGWVAKVKQGQVEQVDDQEKLALPEKASNPEHDETKAEEIVLDTMVRCTASMSSLVDIPE